MSDLNTCGCCDDALPEPNLYNQPGQSTLDYRVSIHAEILERMVAQIGRYPLPDGDHAGTRPLAALTTRVQDDFSIGLLDSWAVLGDVLTFYQERIANEGFLRTATERFSILQLARAIGYELGTGVAAETYLAFMLDESDSTPPTGLIPTGTQVQSIPQKQDEQPQTFETSNDFTAHVYWNLLRPQLTKEQAIQKSTTELFIAGTSSNLNTGDRLLLVKSIDNWDVRSVLQVENQPEKQRTRVMMTAGTRNLPSDAELYVLRQRASIFAHNASDWNGLSKQVRLDYLDGDTDSGEWPDYEVYAPGSVPGPPKVYALPIEATARMVADAVINTAEATAGTLRKSAMAAVPATIMSIGEGVTTVAREVMNASETEVTNFMSFFSESGSIPTPFKDLVSNMEAVIEKLLGSVSINLPDYPEPPKHDPGTDPTFLAYLASLVTYIPELSSEITAGPEFEFTVPDVTDELAQLAAALKDLRDTHPVLLPFKILEKLQAALIDTFTQAHRSADAVASATAATGLSQMLKGVLEAVLDQVAAADHDLSPEEMGTIACFVVKTARYGAMLHAPQILFGEVIDENGDIARARIPLEHLNFKNHDDLIAIVEDLPNELRAALPDEVICKLTEEDRIALATAIGVAAIGPPAVATVALPFFATLPALGGPGIAASVIAPALGTGLLPIVLMGPSVASGIDQIADAVERSVEKALHPADEIITGTRPTHGIQPNRIDLDQAYDKITPNSWAYLESDISNNLYCITDVQNRSRAQFLLSAEVTRLTLDGPELELFASKVRETKVYSAPEELEPARIELPEPVQGTQIALEETPDPLPAVGARLIIKGITMEGHPQAEVVTVKSVNRSSLHFSNALSAAYERDSVEIFANVVPSTHGETIDGEVLGSGNGAEAHQRFVLKKPPITHVSAETPRGNRAELTVRVNDVAWQKADSLYGLAPDAKAFTVRLDNESRAQLFFGDGRMGARLPTGAENVRATYRSGIGLEGEVDAETLTLLQKRPFGVRSVTNPLPADGAEDPELLGQARSNAPLTVKTLERIVSVQDYADFARGFAGVGKVAADVLWDGQAELVHVTVADTTGEAVPPHQISKLRTAMNAARDPARELSFGGFERLSFRMNAGVLVDAAYTRADVETAIIVALQRAFAFEMRDFTQPVSAAEIVTIIHEQSGVLAVDLNQLYLDDEPAALRSVLGAQPARFAEVQGQPMGGQVQMAQLLLIHPEGITLQRMVP